MACGELHRDLAYAVIANPTLLANAVFRAEGAARTLHAGQPPDAIESGVRAAGGSVIVSVIGERLSRDDPKGVALFRQYADRLDPDTRHALGMAAGTLSASLDAAAWVRDRRATLRRRAPTGDAALDAVNTVDATEWRLQDGKQELRQAGRAFARIAVES